MPVARARITAKGCALMLQLAPLDHYPTGPRVLSRAFAEDAREDSLRALLAKRQLATLCELTVFRRRA